MVHNARSLWRQCGHPRNLCSISSNYQDNETLWLYSLEYESNVLQVYQIINIYVSLFEQITWSFYMPASAADIRRNN